MNLSLDRFLYGITGAALGAYATRHVYVTIYGRPNIIAIIMISMVCLTVCFFWGRYIVKHMLMALDRSGWR
jgi:hypothetical protein